MSGPDLESRYRRLLAWYPWSHRRMYEDEMLAVLVAGARPGQRRPTVGESANLVASGLRARARTAVTSFRNPAWVDAAAVVGLLAVLVLLWQRGVRLLEAVIIGRPAPIEPEMYLRAAGWAAVLLATLIGLRLVAAVLAWATVLGEAVLLAGQYENDPVSTVHALWPLVLAMTAAAALAVPAPRRRAVSVLRAPRLLAFVGGLGLVLAIALANAHERAALWNGDTSGTVYVFYSLENRSSTVMDLWMATIAVGALSAALAMLSLPTTVRLRIAVLLAPVVTLAAIVKLTLEGWTYSNGHMGHPIYLEPIQWTLLVVVPLTVLPIGALLVERREQKARLIALGRGADREGPDAVPDR